MENFESIALRATGNRDAPATREAHESLKLQKSGALSIDLLTTKGLHSYDLAGSAIGWKESSMLATKLKELFGDYFTFTGEVDVDSNGTPIVQPRELSGTARALWRVLVEDGWSRERFKMALDGFVRRKHFGKDSWTPFDFTDCSPETDLHDEQWMLGQDESDRPRIESFFHRPTGQCLFRWKGAGCDLPSEYERVK
jgi:hypothetical protein